MLIVNPDKAASIEKNGTEPQRVVTERRFKLQRHFVKLEQKMNKFPESYAKQVYLIITLGVFLNNEDPDGHLQLEMSLSQRDKNVKDQEPLFDMQGDGEELRNVDF